MNKLIIISGLFLLTIGCKSQKETVQKQPNASTEQRDRRPQNGDRRTPPSVDEVFEMDANKDGLLSKAEIGDSPMARRFTTMDANGDGFVSRTEFENAPRPQRRRGNRNQ